MMNHINSFTFCFIPSHFIDAMIIRDSVISAFTSFLLTLKGGIWLVFMRKMHPIYPETYSV